DLTNSLYVAGVITCAQRRDLAIHRKMHTAAFGDFNQIIVSRKHRESLCCYQNTVCTDIKIPGSCIGLALGGLHGKPSFALNSQIQSMSCFRHWPLCHMRAHSAAYS